MRKYILILLFFFPSIISNNAYCQRISLIKSDLLLNVKQRDTNMIEGSEFIKKIENLSFIQAEEEIYREILKGNIPNFLRQFKCIRYFCGEHNKVKVELYCLPDYLAIGSDKDFIRMPMGPLTAQLIADSLNCTLPSEFLVDIIAKASEGSIEPFPFRPKGDRNTYPIAFEDSNNAINALFKAKGYKFGQLISGLKKDVILTSKVTDSLRPNHVTIYGWHYSNGKHIQPSNNVHINTYVDYSHGIRLIYKIIKINGREYDLTKVYSSKEMFRYVSNEKEPMTRSTYAGDMWHQ